jgi:hypothetical protein
MALENSYPNSNLVAKYPMTPVAISSNINKGILNLRTQWAMDVHMIDEKR